MSKKITNADVTPALDEWEVKPTIGIITALPHEYAAVKVLLESRRPIFVTGRGAGRQYLYGEILGPNGGRHRVVLALLPDTGNNQASTRAALLLEHFPSVHTVIMSGIAGGIPNPNKSAEHVRLGDIVVSNREGVVQYDFGKEELIDEKVEFSPRHPPRPPSASLVETARLLQAGELEGERPWVRHIERGVERLLAARPPADTDVLVSSADPDEVIVHPNDPRRIKNLPRVFLGPIASSNTLLKNPFKRDQLRDKFGVKAVEMEGSGIADAAWTVEVQYLVVRGVCDYCDSKKGDDWQVYASIAAAAYTRALLEATPTETSSKDGPPPEGGVQIAGDVNRSVIVSGSNNQITVNAARTDATLPNPSNPTTVNVLSSQLESVSSDLSDEKLERLEELRELFREGAFKEAYKGVWQFRRSPNWVAFSGRLRAAVLRVLATMTLSLKKAEGVAEAVAMAEEATRAEPSQDDVTLRARIKVLAEGREAALGELSSPATVDAFNLRIGLLIEAGRVKEALEYLRRSPEGMVFDAETQRLYALALLATQDMQGARERIGQALAERPRRPYIRFTAAMIDYLSALSPVVLPPHIINYPRPIPFSMVKGDTESRESILRAAEECGRIAEQYELDRAELKDVEAWRVACLASLPDLRRQATELCKKSLADDPGDVRVIPWVLFHGYDIDLTASAAALAQDLESHGEGSTTELEKLVALVGIYLKHGVHLEALHLLENKKQTFVTTGQIDLWHYHRAQVLIADGQPEAAFDDSSKVEDRALRHAIRTAALNKIANRSGDWEPLISYLEKNYEEENNVHSLLTVCDLKGLLGDWQYVADRAELYGDAAGTATTARFIIVAAWNAKRPGQCLRLLDKYAQLFPDGRLPAELRKLRVHCLINIGDIKRAQDEAEQLAQDEPGVENVMLLMDVQLTKGDLTGIEMSARRLLNQVDLTSGQLLRAAHLAQLRNPNLAKKFWMRAVEGATDDPDLTAFAFQMAAKLGVENQRGSLMQRMMEHAAQGQGPVQVMTVEQTLEVMGEGWKRHQELSQMYAAGEAPLQLWAKGGVAQVFRGLSESNRNLSDAHRRTRILFRHGSRTLLPVDYARTSENWRLHCDATSLLLAHELGVLEKVEQLFKPLLIPRHVTTALIEQRDKLKPHQQAQLDDSRVVLDLLSKGKLHVLKEKPPDDSLGEVRGLVVGSWKESSIIGEPEGEGGEDAAAFIRADATDLEQQLGRNRLEMLAAAMSEGSFAVGFLPMSCYGVGRHALLSLPEALVNRVVNCRAVADSLKGTSRIGEEAYREAVRALGVEGREHAAANPLLGCKLFLMQGVADVLARANLLERACNNFEIFIAPSCVEEAEGTVRHYERLARVESWLNELISRVSDGLDDGTYEFINIPDERVAQRDKREEKLDEEFLATLDLFLFEPRQWDVIWVDDRALNKYPLRTDEKGGIPLLGMNEILLALRARGELDEHDYYGLIQRLRDSDFRYVPLEEGEILHHLRQARIEKGSVVTNDALSSLRRYYSSCLLDKEILQLASPVGNTPTPHLELAFVVQVINATANAIAGVWADDKADVGMATARADWILNNFYIGNYGCSHLRRDDVPPSSVLTRAKIIALDLTNLLMRGVSMHGDPSITEPVQRRNHYFNWLIERIISSSYGSDREVVKEIAKELVERFKVVKEQSAGARQNRLFTRAFMGKFFLDLPDIISNEMELDAEMTKWLRLRTGSIITAAGLSFATGDYWRAVSTALADGAANIKTYDGDEKYRLSRMQEGDAEEGGDELSPTLTVIDSDGNKVGVMGDPSFGLLLPDVQARRAALERLRKWFDCEQKEFEAEADVLSSTEDAVTRSTRLYEWRARSSELYYSQLEQKFREREPVFWSDLLPTSPESFAGRLRLPLILEDKSFSDAWRESASALLSEEELLAVVARLASVPVAMPQEIISAVARLPEGDRLGLFERLAPAWTSPLRRLHLVNLILRSSPISETALDTARRVLAKLFDREAGAKDFLASHMLLTFVNEEIETWPEGSLWSGEVRLAVVWAHATRLHAMFTGLGYSPDLIISMVSGARRSSFREPLVRDSEVWTDCAHPRRVNRTRLLTHGVANMLAGIDQPLIEAVGVPGLIRNEVFREVGEGITFPEFSLLGDPSLGEDALLSIFGGDRYALLSGVIGSEGIEILSPETLKQEVQNYLEELIADPPRVINWTWIHMVAEELPLYAELRELCKRALEVFDPLTARKDGFRSAWFTFRAAASQVANMADESLRLRFRDHLVRMLKSEIEVGTEDTSDHEFNSLENRVGALIEVASILSHVPGDPVSSSMGFTSLLRTITELWPDLGRHYRHVLSREIWNLPIEESEGWWHLTLRMRAAA